MRMMRTSGHRMALIESKQTKPGTPILLGVGYPLTSLAATSLPNIIRLQRLDLVPLYLSTFHVFLLRSIKVGISMFSPLNWSSSYLIWQPLKKTVDIVSKIMFGL
jgi:hypothetical protein